MSFGKRGVKLGEQRLSDEDSPPVILRESREITPVGKLGFVDFALFGAGFLAIAACLVIYLKKPPSQPARVAVARPAPIVEETPIVTSDVSPMETIRQRMTTGEDGRTFDFAIIAAPSARCFARLNTERPWRPPGWTNRALDEAKSILKFDYPVAGLALNCLMTEDQRRLCKPNERAKIKKAVAFYLSQYRRDLAAKKRASAPRTAQDQMYADLAERMAAMDPGADDEAADDLAQLFKAIESVTDGGYFTAADFGSAPEFAAHIRPTLAKPCG